MSNHPEASVLRRALQANFAFSGLSAVILLIWADEISDLFGLEMQWPFIGIGISLLFFAGMLCLIFSRPAINPTLAAVVILLDLLWIAGSLVLLLAAPNAISGTGRQLVVIVASIVALFALLQFYGLRRLKAAAARAGPAPVRRAG